MGNADSPTSLNVVNDRAAVTLTLPMALKPPVDERTLQHKQLHQGDFWRRIPAYAEIDEKTILDHKWQSQQTITNVAKLLKALVGVVSDHFIKDAEEGFRRAPMS